MSPLTIYRTDGTPKTSSPSSLSIPMDTWHTVSTAGEPAFQNAWVAAASYPVQFRKDPLGKVQIRGMVKSGTINATVFTLPVGYRPAQNVSFEGRSYSGAYIAAPIFVGTDGTVALWAPGTNTEFSLDVVQFDTDTVTAMPSGPPGPQGLTGPQGGNSTVLMDTWHTIGAVGEPAFSNGWRQSNGTIGVFGPASFRKDPLGFVMLKGLVDKNGGNWIPGETIFMLPAGYRPMCHTKYEVAGYSPTSGWFGTVQMNVLITGEVQIGDHGGGTNPVGWLNFSEIMFDTGTVTQMPSGPAGPTGATGGNATVPMDGMHYIGGSGEPAFASGWVNYDNNAAAPGTLAQRSLRYRKYPDGVVRLAGCIKNGASGTTITTLPAGFRPPSDVDYLVWAAGGTAYITIIAATGVVTVTFGTGNGTAYMFMDAIEFDTETVTQVTVGPKGDTGAPGGTMGASYAAYQTTKNVPVGVVTDIDGWTLQESLDSTAYSVSGRNIVVRDAGVYDIHVSTAGVAGTTRFYFNLLSGALGTYFNALGPVGGGPSGTLSVTRQLAAGGSFLVQAYQEGAGGNLTVNCQISRVGGPQGIQGVPGNSITVPMDTWHTVGAVGEPAFQNSWANYPGGAYTAQFRKDPLGKVQCRGLLINGTLGTTAFKLPAGYWPTQAMEFVNIGNATVAVRTIVNTDGTVIPYGSNVNHSLVNIEFDTDTVTAMPTGPQGPPGAPGPSTPVQRVTSLPNNTFDGLEVYLVAAVGPPAVIWHMRFNGTSGKWEYIGGPPISYQAEGANAGYVGATNGTNITVDAGSATLLQWLFTPPLDCWIELTMNVGLMAKTDAAYHYAYLNLIGSPAPAIGTVSSGPYQTQHSQVQQYMGYQFTKRFALTAGVAYQFYGQWATSGGVWSYYQGPGTLWLTGKAWPR